MDPAPEPITLRLISYERGGREKTAATLVCFGMVLIAWVIFGWIYFLTPDEGLKAACILGGVAAAISAGAIALNGLRREELFLDGRQLIVETTRRAKIKEAIFQLAPDSDARVEFVAGHRPTLPSGGQGTAVVLRTDDGGTCWVATQARREEQESVAAELNRYLALVDTSAKML